MWLPNPGGHLGQGVKILGQVGDEHIHQLSPKARHVRLRVDRPRNLVEGYALHASHEVWPSKGAFAHSRGLWVERHGIELGDVGGHHDITDGGPLDPPASILEEEHHPAPLAHPLVHMGVPHDIVHGALVVFAKVVVCIDIGDAYANIGGREGQVGPARLRLHQCTCRGCTQSPGNTGKEAQIRLESPPPCAIVLDAVSNSLKALPSLAQGH